MSVKPKPLHWCYSLLSENPSFSYNSPLVNQKPVCYFKSKYPVSITDEEWLLVLEKSFKFWSSSLPPYVHMVEGKGGCTFSTVKCLLLVVIWQFLLCGFNFSCSWRHCIQISQIRIWSVRNDATSDNWVLSIIKCQPVLINYKNYRKFKNHVENWYISIMSWPFKHLHTLLMHNINNTTSKSYQPFNLLFIKLQFKCGNIKNKHRTTYSHNVRCIFLHM